AELPAFMGCRVCPKGRLKTTLIPAPRRGVFLATPRETNRSFRMPRFLSACFGLLLVVTSAACSTPPPAIATNIAGWHGPVSVGTITEPAVNEASGLAPSHRTADLLWINNDSGGQP